MMFKKILVPTDASVYSQRALKTALELARKYNSEVELLYVIPEVSNSLYDPIIPSPEQIEQEGEHIIVATLKGIDISGVTLNSKKIEGKPWKVILQEVENENIDLVVMGSHGYGAIVGSLLGSVCQNVLHGATCPVLVV